MIAPGHGDICSVPCQKADFQVPSKFFNPSMNTQGTLKVYP